MQTNKQNHEFWCKLPFVTLPTQSNCTNGYPKKRKNEQIQNDDVVVHLLLLRFVLYIIAISDLTISHSLLSIILQWRPESHPLSASLPPNTTKSQSQSHSKPSPTSPLSSLTSPPKPTHPPSPPPPPPIGPAPLAGAFTYVCLLPLDTIKTKMQTKGAARIYKNTLDAIVKTFQSSGILGFYSGVSAVVIGSTASSAVYFGTCEFGKSFLAKLDNFPAVLIPPTAGAMGNVVSSAIMVPKELITQRMQAGAKGRSWQVLLEIVQNDGVMGLYAGYSATLLRNLPAGVLNYSSFEYLKAAVLKKGEKPHLEPVQSVLCGALSGAISASLTTPLDVVKTRLMTQVRGEGVGKVAAVMYDGVSATVKQILKEEGWVGLTRGMGPRVIHSACFSALGYFAFETARLGILREYVRRKEERERESEVSVSTG